MDEYLTIGQAATLLQVSQSTVRRWIAQNELPAYRVGQRKVRLKRADLGRLITPVRRGQKGGIMRHAEADRRRAQFGITPPTDEQKQRALDVVAEARKLQAEIAGKYGLFEDSAAVLREMREERTQQLDDVH